MPIREYDSWRKRPEDVIEEYRRAASPNKTTYYLKRKSNDNSFDGFFEYGDTSPLNAVFDQPTDHKQNTYSKPTADNNTNTASKPFVIPKMDNTNFSMPVGMGSWFNLSPRDWEAWYNAKNSKAIIENEKAKLEREREMVRRFIATHPELSGEDPEAWDYPSIVKLYAQIKSSNKTENPLKVKAQELKNAGQEFLNKRRQQELEKAKAEAEFLKKIYGQDTRQDSKNTNIGGRVRVRDLKTRKTGSIPSEKIDAAIKSGRFVRIE